MNGNAVTTNVNLSGNSAAKAATATSVEFEVLNVGESLTTIVFSFLGANINYVPTGLVSYTETDGTEVEGATVAVVDRYPKIDLDLQNGTETTTGTHANTLGFSRVTGVTETNDFERTGVNITELAGFDRTPIASSYRLCR